MNRLLASMSLLALGCGGPEPPPPPPVEAPASTATADAERRAQAAERVASATPTASATASGAEPASASTSVAIASSVPAPAPLRPVSCTIPARKPNDLSVRIVRHLMPIHKDDSWEGLEVHGSGVTCPRDPAASVLVPCRALSDEAMDRVYRALKAARFCTLHHRAGSTTPHYGSRFVAVAFGGGTFEVGDSSTELLDQDSSKRFDSVVDTVIGAANAAP